MIGWVLVNSYLAARLLFDPYPFILLNLVLSMVAALQGPIIMMSQSRQAATDWLQATHDCEVQVRTRAAAAASATEVVTACQISRLLPC